MVAGWQGHRLERKEIDIVIRVDDYYERQWRQYFVVEVKQEVVEARGQ